MGFSNNLRAEDFGVEWTASSAYVLPKLLTIARWTRGGVKEVARTSKASEHDVCNEQREWEKIVEEARDHYQ